MSNNSKKLTLAGLVVLLCLVSAATFAITWGFIKLKEEDLLPQGVYVGEIDVSNLSVTRATELIKNSYTIPDRDLQLVWTGGSYTLDMKRFQPEIDLPRLENELKKALPKGNYFQRRAYKKNLKKGHREIKVRLKFDENEFNKLVTELDKKIAVEAKDAAFIVNIFDQLSIANEQNGLKVDYNSLLSELPNFSSDMSTLEVPTLVVKPKVTAAQLTKMGIESLVASFSTEFDPKNLNRVDNLKLAATALDGTILRPGEEFSFNAWVGPRIRELGYKDAPVLVSGEITEDVGGGVCQVSSTLYNMALLSGMEIIERKPHSAPVSYISPGRDAAVAFDYLDLRFRNTQNNHILITASIAGNRIFCKVFGSPLTEQIKVTTENLESIPFEVKKGSTPKPGRRGTKVDTYIIKGTQKELISQDMYKPMDQIVL